MNIVRRLGEAALLAMLILGPMMASAADAPVIESIVDRDSGTTLWSTTIPDARPLLSAATSNSHWLLTSELTHTRELLRTTMSARHSGHMGTK